jgi:iron complex transport system permease protein
VSAAVALSGLIGFVGLVVPHLVRRVVGADQRYVVPLSFIVGATFVVVSDAVARSLFTVASTTIPVGAVTAMVGAPLFFVLLVRARSMESA